MVVQFAKLVLFGEAVLLNLLSIIKVRVMDLEYH